MSDHEDDEKLRRAFGALRREDARRAPSLEEIRRPRRRRTSRWAVGLPVASLAAAAALALWLQPAATSTRRVASAAPPAAGTAVAVAGHEEAAPLDFLLDVPGLTLNGVPDFDTSSLRGSLR
ncbi:MAG: hypothetical protein JWP97_1886 [Labilithrix sp.]|nr:hypothetical protein [Labilithrix sp.]